MAYYRKRPLWTEEETGKAIAMKEAGASWPEMERALGRSRSTISMKLLAHRRGQEMYTAAEWVARSDRMEALYLKGVEMHEIAKIYDIKTVQVTAILARRGLDEETRAMETTDAP